MYIYINKSPNTLPLLSLKDQRRQSKAFKQIEPKQAGVQKPDCSAAAQKMMQFNAIIPSKEEFKCLSREKAFKKASII